jgi:hypothetical protein
MGESALEVVYTRHLRARLELRRFPADLPRKIFEDADRRYRNGVTGHVIAVKQVRLRGRTRRLMIAYDETHVIEIVTIHPISEEQERSRVKGRRWIRLG